MADGGAEAADTADGGAEAAGAAGAERGDSGTSAETDRAPAVRGAPEAPRALDVDGIVVVSLGTVAWGVALVVALVLHGRLSRGGHLWWIACAAVGFGLGLLGIGYCVRRRNRLGDPDGRVAEA